MITSKYQDAQWFVIDNDFAEQARRDTTWQFYARIHNNQLSWYNLTPAISYTYTIRDFNSPNHTFDKHRVEIEIIRRF